MSREADLKMARTESLFRGVNERIAETAERFDGAGLGVSFVCECGDLACTDRVHATSREYEEVRSDGAQFLMVEGHVEPCVGRNADRLGWRAPGSQGGVGVLILRASPFGFDADAAGWLRRLGSFAGREARNHVVFGASRR